MSPDEAASDRLTAAWWRTQGRLPEGWTLDSLRCASTVLSQWERSDEWIAVAVDAAGTERRYRASDPIAALDGLARET